MKYLFCSILILTITFSILFKGKLRADYSEQLPIKKTYSLFDCFDKKNLNLVTLVPTLLETGHNPNTTVDGETILHRAILSAKNYEGYPLWKEFLKTLTALVQSGANINTKYKERTAIQLAFDLYLIPKFDENRYTINGLHLAQILEPFLLAGFDPKNTYKIQKYPYVERDTQLSYLQISVNAGYKELSELMLGDKTINERSCPFERWDLSCIRKKIQRGDDFSHYGLFVLSRGTSIGFLGKFERKKCQVTCMILLENGFDPRKADHLGQTPLHISARMGNREVVELLLKNGAIADIEAKDSQGFTPLMTAAFAQEAESFTCLVNHGADLQVKHPRLYGWTLQQYIERGQFNRLKDGLRRTPDGTQVLR